MELVCVRVVVELFAATVTARYIILALRWFSSCFLTTWQPPSIGSSFIKRLSTLPAISTSNLTAKMIQTHTDYVCWTHDRLVNAVERWTSSLVTLLATLNVWLSQTLELITFCCNGDSETCNMLLVTNVLARLRCRLYMDLFRSSMSTSRLRFASQLVQRYQRDGNSVLQ